MDGTCLIIVSLLPPGLNILTSVTFPLFEAICTRLSMNVNLNREIQTTRFHVTVESIRWKP